MPSPADDPLRDCWFLTGATASGKTSIGVRLAERLGAEIASLDSMAIYRGMDIGTAKPSAAIRAAAPHHLLDLVDPTEDFSVSQYRERAFETIEGLRQRGKRTLFVGGTPLYLKAMLRGLFQGPPADWEFRRAIEAEIAEHGVASLHQRLQVVDPLTAHKLHPNDQRRMIRALEVLHVTGTPISHLQLEFDEPSPFPPPPVITLHWDRSLLHRRIEQRVERMFAEGLVAEVQRLLEQYGELGRTASQAVGYQEVIEYLRGERGLPETIEAVKVRTRRFARRQETWFRGMSECRWVEMREEESPEALVDRIMESVGEPT